MTARPPGTGGPTRSVGRIRAIRLVAMREILERGRSRGYVLALLFTVFLLGAGFLLPALIVSRDQSTRIALVGDTPAQLRPALQASADRFDAQIDVSVIADPAAAKAAVQDGSIVAALIVPADLSTPGELVVREQASDQLRSIVSSAVIALRAGSSGQLLAPPTITALQPPGPQDTERILLANAGIILMFIGIFTYGTWVLTGVVEEKQSRVIEVVLSTVRPRDLLIGKVLGIGLLALVQLVILVVFGIAAAQLSGRFTLPTTTLDAVLMLVIWFVLGFAFYATSMGTLGALASRVDEAQNAAMPVSMMATLSYILSLVLVTRDPSGVMAQVMTFLPPSAPMVVPLRAALGAIEAWQVVVSIVIMIAAIWLLFVLGGQVYSGAVLQTGSRMKLLDAWRASR